jgi:hypothetical protein
VSTSWELFNREMEEDGIVSLRTSAEVIIEQLPRG